MQNRGEHMAYEIDVNALVEQYEKASREPFFTGYADYLVAESGAIEAVYVGSMIPGPFQSEDMYQELVGDYTAQHPDKARPAAIAVVERIRGIRREGMSGGLLDGSVKLVAVTSAAALKERKDKDDLDTLQNLENLTAIGGLFVALTTTEPLVAHGSFAIFTGPKGDRQVFRSDPASETLLGSEDAQPYLDLVDEFRKRSSF
jgi:hypothetical protein